MMLLLSYVNEPVDVIPIRDPEVAMTENSYEIGVAWALPAIPTAPMQLARNPRIFVFIGPPRSCYWFVAGQPTALHKFANNESLQITSQ
jgi:hypothetical protein